MKSTTRRATPVSTLLLLAAFLTACSGVRFNGGNGSSSSGGTGSTDSGGTDGGAGDNGGPDSGAGSDSANNNGSAGGGGDSNGAIVVGGGPNGSDLSSAGGAAGPITGTGNSPATVLPKLQFIGPPCIRGTNCAIMFKLDKAYSAQTEFDWRTDDTLYGTPPLAGLAMWGKAGYHYVSTSGHVVFPPGTTEQTVYVRNINPENVAISIGVIMSKCAYSTLYEGCSKFFVP